MMVDFEYIVRQPSYLLGYSAIFALMPDGAREPIEENVNHVSTFGEARRVEASLIVRVSSNEEFEELKRLYRQVSRPSN